jgi:uncharacterized membrane protein
MSDNPVEPPQPPALLEPTPAERASPARLLWAVPVAYAAGAGLHAAALASQGASNLPRAYAQGWTFAWMAGLVWAAATALAAAPLLTALTQEARATVLRRVGTLVVCLGVVAVAAPMWSTHGAHLTLAVAAWLFALPLALGLTRLPPSAEKLLAWRWLPHAAGAGVGGWYFVVSYLRHAWFGSGSRDMGLFLQSVWLLSRFKSPNNTIMGMHAFGDHMEFIDLLVAPLMWVWPDAGALLLVQALLAGSGAIPLFRMAAARAGTPVAGLLAAGAYLVAHQVVSGIMFDWNPTTLALGLLPWAVEAALHKAWRRMAVVLVLVALCKENLLLYVTGFGIWLAVLKAPPRIWLTTTVAPLVAFVIEMKFIFPLFRADGFRHFYYGDVGTDFLDVAVNMLQSPARGLTVLFNPPQKATGVLLPFSATAGLALLEPGALVPLLPGVLERYWSNFQNSWWGHHYGGPTHALALCAAVLGAARVGPWLGNVLGGAAHAARLWPYAALLAASVGTAFFGPWGAADLFVLHKPYHPSAEDRTTMANAVASIPDGASVAAQNYLVAHLAAREHIYLLEHAQQADYVAMTPTTNPWPYDRGYHDRLAQQLLGQGWRVHFCQGNSVVLSRTPGDSTACPALGR